MSLELRDLSFTYGEDTVYEIAALKQVNLTIGDHEFIGIIGHTGSGKSTLIQHFNGLMRATSGDLLYNGKSIYEKNFSMPSLRQKVGLVFQYPEHQLFESDVFSDVCFGPKNLGLSKAEIQKRAKRALELVGMGEEMYYKSPFDLSGGQKRRAAIAGVLAMEPEVLVLDEPTAGLDPRGRDQILDQIRKLYERQNISVVLVSHSMEDVAKYVNRLIVMDDGQIVYDDTPKAIFAHYKKLEHIGLKAPEITYAMASLREAGIPVPEDITTTDEAVKALTRLFSRENGKDIPIT